MLELGSTIVAIVAGLTLVLVLAGFVVAFVVAWFRETRLPREERERRAQQLWQGPVNKEDARKTKYAMLIVAVSYSFALGFILLDSWQGAQQKYDQQFKAPEVSQPQQNLSREAAYNSKQRKVINYLQDNVTDFVQTDPVLGAGRFFVDEVEFYGEDRFIATVEDGHILGYLFGEYSVQGDDIFISYLAETFGTLSEPTLSELKQKHGFIESIDTSTWQTYRNDEFGFEMRIPDDWKLELPSQDRPGLRFELPRQDGLELSLIVAPFTRYMEVFSNQERIDELLRVGDIRDVVEDIENIQVGDDPGLMWGGIYCDPGCGGIVNVYNPQLVENNIHIYVTAYNVSDKLVREDNFKFPWSIKEKNQVVSALSTIRFIESSVKNVELRVLSPNGGEVYRQGESFDIKWQPSKDVIRVVVEVIREDTGKVSAFYGGPVVNESVSVNDGSLNLKIPQELQPGNYIVQIMKCPSEQIIVSCVNSDLKKYGYDVSDAPFTVTELP